MTNAQPVPPVLGADGKRKASLQQNLPILRISLVVAALWLATSASFALRQSAATQFAFMGALLAMFVAGCLSVAEVASHWRRDGWRTVAPLGVCLATAVVTPFIGKPLAKLAFERALPQCESVIAQIESGEFPVTDKLQSISAVDRSLAYAVLAQKNKNGVLTVEFLTGGGFPVKHSGYLYSSSGVVEAGSIFDSRWPRRYQIAPRWFRISD